MNILSFLQSSAGQHALKNANLPKGNDNFTLKKNLDDRRDANKIAVQKTPREIQAYFIGPRGENS